MTGKKIIWFGIENLLGHIAVTRNWGPILRDKGVNKVPLFAECKPGDVIPHTKEFLLIYREPDEMMVKGLSRVLFNEKVNPAPPESLAPFNDVIYPHSVRHCTRHIVIFWVL